MTLYGRSLELCGIQVALGTVTEEVNSNNYDTTYGIRVGIFNTSSTAYIFVGADQFGGPFSTEFWHRWTMGGSSGASNGRTLFEYYSGATAVFRMQCTADRVGQMQYWDGSAWQNVGATFAIPNGRARYDLKIVCGASFELYISTDMAQEGTLLASGSATMTLVTAIDDIRAYSSNPAAPHRLAEWIWGDEPTVGHHYAWKPPSGNGTDTAGSGSYLDVDEGTTNDSDVSTLAANGDAETYIHATMTLPAGTVKAVQVESRVRKTATGAQNVKARLRIGATAYDQASNYAGIDSVFKAYVARWGSNPAGGAWDTTTAGQVSNEFGLLAQT